MAKVPSFKEFARKQYYRHMGWPRPSKLPTKPMFDYVFRDLESNENLMDKGGNPIKERAFSAKQAVWVLKRNHPTLRYKNFDVIKISPPVLLSVPPVKQKPYIPPQTVEGELGLSFTPTPRRYNDH